MANWTGSARTNYFKVKDEATFRDDMGHFDVEVIEKDGRLGLISTDYDYGDWPSLDYRGVDPAADDDPPSIWFPEVVAPYLADGEVAVFKTIGAEKLRYLTGIAVAIDNSGEYVAINLDDIYDKAQARFGVRPTEAMH